MGEILPDGSIQGYFGKCKIFGKEIPVNIQESERVEHNCIRQLQAERDQLKSELEHQKQLYADHIGDEHENCGVAINQRLKSENERLRSERDALKAENERLLKYCFKSGLMAKAPCFNCGYNGTGYFQPDKHACAKLHHAALAAK